MVEVASHIGPTDCTPHPSDARAADARAVRLARHVHAIDKEPTALGAGGGEDVADHILEVLEPGARGGLDPRYRGRSAASGAPTACLPHRAMLRATGLERATAATTRPPAAVVIKATRKCGKNNVALIGDFFFFFEMNLVPVRDADGEDDYAAGWAVDGAEVPSFFLLNAVLEGKYDPSWMFTHEDDSENISGCSAKFHEHKIPGGLKVLLTTEFGCSHGK